MKRTTILLIILSGILLSCSINVNAHNDDDNGVMVKSTEYKKQKMNNIKVEHAFKVRIIKTNSRSDNRIELNVSERVKPYIKTTLTRGRLHVTLEDTPNNFSPKKGEMFLDIYTENFSKVQGSNATEITVTNGNGFGYMTGLLQIIILLVDILIFGMLI